jgi:hypothetical protein
MKQSEIIEALKNSIRDQVERVNTFKKLGEAALSSSPSKDSWNALQCLEHLNRYADFYVRSIGEKISKNKTRTKTKTDDLKFSAGYWGNKFVKSMLPGENGKIKKMRTFKSKNPSFQEAKADSLERFLDNQEKWLDILDKARYFDLNHHKCSLTIPIIKMNLGATLQFVIAHQERHINQAERAVSAVQA